MTSPALQLGGPSPGAGLSLVRGLQTALSDGDLMERRSPLTPSPTAAVTMSSFSHRPPRGPPHCYGHVK